MVEGSTGTQGQHSQIVGTPVISGCHSQVAQVTIVLSNGILDSHTLVVDELEDFIGRSTWLNICLISWQILCYQRHTTILANQQEVEIGTSPAGLPLVVVILIHLGHKVFVEFVVFKLQTSELIEEHIAVCNAMITGCPDGAVGIGGTPCTIEETLDGVSIV